MTRPVVALSVRFPPWNERCRSCARSTTTFRLVAPVGKVKRMSPARRVAVVSSLILFVNVVEK
jgi:hypothetical protein